MKPAREAMKKVVAERMKQFGQAGHAHQHVRVPEREPAPAELLGQVKLERIELVEEVAEVDHVAERKVEEQERGQGREQERQH